MLLLRYRLASGRFTAENLTITLRVAATAHVWRPGQPNTGNLGGTRRTLDETGGDVPLEPGLISRDGWALFDDSRGVVFPSDDGWVRARPVQSVQDWYFFGYGHAYTDALAEYTQFGGTVPLIPRYELGIWWSRYWHYSAEDLQQLVTDFAEHDLPLDVLVVDMDWHTPGHWTGYSWNQELFPDPVAFLAAMHARGLRVTLNLHPADGVLPHETAYADFAAKLGITDSTPIPFRITDRTFAEQYFALLHHPLEDQGVDFWWIDWQQGESTEIAGLDPLIWLNHLHFTDARRRSQRPLLFSRWGGLGNHRYPLGFSGDTFGGWATLAALPHFTATAANVGFGWWSHDIGGHFGAVEPELFVRWVQFGALSPCLRLHATKDPLGERRPWAFPPPVLEAARQAFALRYQLMPYIYTMARHTHDRAIALCRPMYYAYPEHDAAYQAQGQYGFGDDLIAAPITQAADPQSGLATRDVWIPPGTWYRFATGEALVGPRWVRLSGDLTAMPLFAREGAIVPLASPALHLADLPQDHLELRIFPGSQGTFRLYEDDGISEGYLQGAHEWTTFTATTEGTAGRSVRIAPVKGHCPSLPSTRSYLLTFVAVDRPHYALDGNGAALEWNYDAPTRSLRVALPPAPKREGNVVRVHWQPAPHANGTEQPPTHTAPFAHVIAHTAYDKAFLPLGQVVLVPPYAANGHPQPFAAHLSWRQTNYVGIAEVTQDLADLHGETTAPVPFALDPTWQPQQWAVETRLVVGESQFHAVQLGPHLQPPIQRWHICYAGQVTWHVLQADPLARTNLTDPYTAQLDTKLASQVEATTIIDLPMPTTIAFDTWTSAGLTLTVDGEAFGAGVAQPTLAGLTRHWPVTRFGPRLLAAGRHHLTLQLVAPESGPWFFGVLLVEGDGLPLMRVATA